MLVWDEIGYEHGEKHEKVEARRISSGWEMGHELSQSETRFETNKGSSLKKVTAFE